ncbi:MAG: gluconate 2-dehydrogenase subunit 3 family protein [Vicinamibacterales bacterium]
MSGLDRRSMLRLLAAAPMAAGFAWTEAEAATANVLSQAVQAAARAGTPFTPKFFTAHEWETVRMLVDIIIPRDERSGSATDAGVPEFMDFIMLDEPKLPEESRRQTSMRGGLAWLDLECQHRFDKMFVGCTDAERASLLDEISWPAPKTTPVEETDVPVPAHGRAFFFSFRDLTASGFWTTKAGMADLQYMGNHYVAEWTGCPDEALKKLGVSYPKA